MPLLVPDELHALPRLFEEKFGETWVPVITPDGPGVPVRCDSDRASGAITTTIGTFIAAAACGTKDLGEGSDMAADG